jgi:hypothetical protein
MLRTTTWLAIILACCSTTLSADEPNESFGEATILEPGVLSVDDDLSLGNAVYPDTMVASLNTAGFFIDENNDGGPWEGSLGSGLTGIPINNDSSFWFIVTGYPDFNYSGDHIESGDYHVYVDIYDDFGFYEETIEYDATLEPGVVHQFSLDEFNTNYTYDVFIDNTVGGASNSDVDFFTFTGLSVGASFTAEVTQETLDGFDSILGWFDENGDLLVTDDDSGVGELSLLTGTVPSSGNLTFAVTGYDDFDFEGLHGEVADYSLGLTLVPDELGGDFDGDGDIDGRDFLLWQRNPSVGSLADWQANYGEGSLAAVAAVPEPGTLLMLIAACGLATITRHR